MKQKRHNAEALNELGSEEVKKQVLLECQQQEFEKGDQIVRAHDGDSNVYFIDSGCVRVILYSRRGKEVSFTDISAGGHFGELSAIDGEPRSANVLALEKTTITIMPAEVFVGLVEQYPQVSLFFLRQLTAMVRRLCDRIFEYSTLGVTHRIRAEILRIARQCTDLDGVARIKNMPTHSQLGARLSCNREAVSREVNYLQRAGIIKRGHRKFIIEDISRLERLIELGKKKK